MRRGHPAAAGDLPPARFAGLRHLDTSSALDDTRFIADWVAEQAR